MIPAAITTSQLDEVLHRGRMIDDDMKRDEFFAAVVAALRDVDSVDDDALRKIVGAAFEPFNPRRDAPQ
jgi:hypothetical protein